jgi:excisionase family DNA binding protein
MTPDAGGDERATLTLQQAADHLGVHYMTAYRYVRTGRLPAIRRDGRWSVATADVAALADSRAGTPTHADGDGRDDHSRGDGRGVDRYRARLLERMLAGDEAGAWHVVESALVARMRPDRAHIDLLAPCLRELGERWAAGTVAVGDEHVATATAIRLAARLAPLRVRRGRTRGTVVVAGAPGEQHGLPITLLTNVLRSRGWGVVELGPNTPGASVVDAARHADRLVAVAISVGSDETFGSSSRMLAGLATALPGVPLLVGGPGVPDGAVAHRLGGEAWGADADEVDALLARRLQPRGGMPVPPTANGTPAE